MKINKFEFSGSFRTPLDPLIRIIFLSLVSADGETCILNFEECSGVFFGRGGGCAYVYQWHFFNSYVIKKPIPQDSIYELYGTPPKS